MKKVLLMFALIAVGSTASALTLKEKKQVKEWNDYLVDADSSYVKTVKDKCGSEIPLTMEDAFATAFMPKNANAAAYCDATRRQISSMCEDATSKEAIAAKIKKIHCTVAKKEDEASFKLAGGTLTFTVGIKASNLDDKVKEYLENNL